MQPRRILQRRRVRMPPQQGLLHDQLPLLAVRLPSASPGLQLQGQGNGQVSDEVVQVLPGWKGVRSAPLRELWSEGCVFPPKVHLLTYGRA